MKYDKVNLNRTPLSPEEINAAMDFDGLLNPQAGVTMKGSKIKYLKKGMYLISTAVVLIGGYYVWNLYNSTEPNSIEQASIVVPDQEEFNEPEALLKEVINPPLKGYEKDYNLATVNAQNGGIVRLGSSDVIVPTNAFVDKDGNLISGDVELRYKEYKDVLDIFLSGIPMEYDSAGVSYTFESNGMFELNGFQNNEAVAIAPNKSLEVKMDIEEQKPGFSEYYLNEDTGNWEFLNGQRYEVDQKLVNLTEDIASNEEESNDAEEIPGKIDSPETDALEAKIQNTASQKKQLNQPMKPREADPALPQIQLEVNFEDFPELKAFKNTLFQVAEEDVKDFNMAWGEETWTDMSINKSSKPGYYRMVFSKPGRREMVKAAPVLAEKDMDNAMEVYDELYSQYQNSLDSLEVEKKRMERELKEAREKIKQEQKEFREKIERENEQRKKANYTTNNITALFTVNRFGVFNCDTPRNLPKGKTVLANYETENGDPIHQTIKLIEEGNRAIYHFYSGYKQLKFNPNQKNLLISVTDDNKIAVVKPEEFKEIEKKSGKCVIKMKECEEELTSKREIEEFVKEQGFEI